MDATTILKSALQSIMKGGTLSVDRADAAMEALTDESVPREIVGGILCALSARGETTDEIAGFARAMRRLARTVHHPFERVVDTCGTGGDGRHTLNISTASAILTAAIGLPVLKHGNRAVSSRCGSADVLQALGVPMPDSPEAASNMLEATGFAFLFAPYFHPAMKAVAPVRRNLGVRTVFNILGPLVNPGMVRHQVIGVFHPELMERLGPVFSHLQHRRVLLLHHEEGFDEALSIGKTRGLLFDRGNLQTMEISGKSFGFKQDSHEALLGGDASTNAETLVTLFRNPDRVNPVVRETIVLNTALALFAGEAVPTIEEGLVQAESALMEGRAYEKLEQIRNYRVV